MRSLKVVFVGDTKVGKSSILTRFVHGQFDRNIAATVGAAFLTKVVESKTGNVRLQLWDTAGQEKFRSLAPMYYRSAAVAVLVYDVTQPGSKAAIVDWAAEIADRAPPSTKIVVVGNKIDATTDRVLFREQGEEIANEIGAVAHFETSALTGEGINDMFTAIADFQAENDDVVERSAQKKSTNEGGCGC